MTPAKMTTQWPRDPHLGPLGGARAPAAVTNEKTTRFRTPAHPCLCPSSKGRGSKAKSSMEVKAPSWVSVPKLRDSQHVTEAGAQEAAPSGSATSSRYKDVSSN